LRVWLREAALTDEKNCGLSDSLASRLAGLLAAHAFQRLSEDASYLVNKKV
jgi:hypothetical protein